LIPGKKPAECDVPDLLEAICGFSKPFLKLFINLWGIKKTFFLEKIGIFRALK
jgi:hypothetical protein